MPTQTFQPGDLVKLISEGPLMTVVSTDEYNSTCAWFNKNEDICSHEFANFILNKIDPDGLNIVFS